MDREIEHVDDLTPEELEAETAEALPERAAMSTLNLASLDPAGGAVEAVGDGVPEQGPADVHGLPAHANGHGPPSEPNATAAQHSQVIADRGAEAASEPTDDRARPRGDAVADPAPGQRHRRRPGARRERVDRARRRRHGGDDLGGTGRTRLPRRQTPPTALRRRRHRHARRDRDHGRRHRRRDRHHGRPVGRAGHRRSHRRGHDRGSGTHPRRPIRHGCGHHGGGRRNGRRHSRRPARSATPPARSATPPARSATPPARSATPPARSATPPARSATPPATVGDTAAHGR